MTRPTFSNIADCITWHAHERPWAVAIVEQNAVIHYRTLERLIWAAASHLVRAGIRPGDVVGIALPHSGMYLVAVYALARIGAVSTALPTSDPAPLRESLAGKFGVKFVVASAPGAGPSGIPTVLFNAETVAAAPASLPSDIRAPGGDRPWVIRRTSGTTSEAKGIEISHRALLDEFQAQTAYFPGPHDRMIAVVPMSLTYGLHMCKRTLFAGGGIVVADSAGDTRAFLGLMDIAAVTWANLTPSMMAALLTVLPDNGCRAPSLAGLVASGMAMPDALRQAIRRRLSNTLSIRYGSNEAGYLTAADAEMQERFPETVGRALPGVEIETVDDTDVPVAAGEAGHIRARTPWMPKGYVNAPEAGNRTFRNGWIYTGDIGVLHADGMLFIKGRSDDMMNYDGIKIMPADIEEVLLAHPAVLEAVAFPVASRSHQHLPAAAVIVRSGVSVEELLAHCRRRLGLRAPLAITIESVFPRNAMGKVLRNELADKIAQKMSATARN